MFHSTFDLLLLGLVVGSVQCDGIFFDEPHPVGPAIPKILSAEASGSGCPQGTTKFLTQGDAPDYLEFQFLNFTAEAGGTGAPRVVSKNCEVHLSLDAGTPGWQVALGKVTVLGSAAVDPNATFTAYVTSWWSFTNFARITHEIAFKNPGAETKSGNVTVELQTETEGAWSPCIGENGNVGIANINFRVAMLASETSGLAAFGRRSVSSSENATTTAVTERLQWIWRLCETEIVTSSTATPSPSPSSSATPVETTQTSVSVEPTETSATVKPTETGT